jgi:hypothetical protein
MSRPAAYRAGITVALGRDQRIKLNGAAVTVNLIGPGSGVLVHGPSTPAGKPAIPGSATALR